MSSTNLQHLIQSLDRETKNALQTAAERCLNRGGSEILIEDMLLALLEPETGFFSAMLKQFGLSREQVLKVLQPSRKGRAAESQNPVFSSLLVQWLQDAYMLGNLEFHQEELIAGCLLLALLDNPGRYAHTDYYQALSAISPDELRKILAGLLEQASQESAQSAASDDALNQFTENLTEQARTGKIDPVLCRDNEIRQMVDILARRRKNNPIVVGEAGVGKTAAVEGLALRIAEGRVPEVLKHAEILSLDMGRLQAGASVKGEFERRLGAVIDGVKASIRDIILFIDEAHTLIGAGNQAGGGDAANLLKPALARGELRTIAATTWSEYKKYFEKDAALARRFQPVQLMEPTVDQAVTIMRGLAERYEESHGVFLRDDAVVAAAELSARYLTGRQLPDKAVDVLDTACARVRISLNAKPAELEDTEQSIAELTRELQAFQRDFEAGLSTDKQRLDTMQATLVSLNETRDQQEQDWNTQRELATRILDVRQTMASTSEEEDEESRESLREELNALQISMIEAQRKACLVHYEVSPALVGEVISHWTGIPLGSLVEERSRQVLSFPERMKERIKGQDHAIDALNNSVRAAAAGLENPNAPAGVFLLAGPSGVGKTETAIAMADLLYGGERFLTTINMSEFQEKHTVSRLIGSPPGYVGYGEGGVLTEAVRQKPYSVVLLDEVEKADPDVLNLFYQVFDKGMANDGEGREINFRNTLILMTTNLGSDTLTQLCQQEEMPDHETLAQAIRSELNRFFKPALLARMTLVPYVPINPDVMQMLVRLKLKRLANRLAQQNRSLDWNEALELAIASRCTQAETGARNIDYIINGNLMPVLSERLLTALSSGQDVARITITLEEDGSMDFEFSSQEESGE